MFNSDLLLESEKEKGSAFHFTVELKICENRKRYINDENIKHLDSLEGIRLLISWGQPGEPVDSQTVPYQMGHKSKRGYQWPWSAGPV